MAIHTDPDAVDTAERRLPLSRELIITSAVLFVDENGLPALTMRGLGKELGVEAMSLYRYVNGREDLLEGIVESMVSELHLDPATMEPMNGWQGYLQWLAHGVRRIAHEHPAVFPLIATRHPAAPWLRPPLRSLKVVEDFLSELITRGFSDESAIAAYRAFSSFLLGHLLLESAALTKVDVMAEPLSAGGVSPDSFESSIASFPQVARLGSRLSEDHSDSEFEASLENMLDRLDRTLAH
ncbi:MAG: TetR/AcrR family transcriptional regulator C-terminal domain-containing protein [Geodermatophilaceae bacterium]|nr:TetR/AcrR family transcriptional regulator C-terminal domain-containing protein [Geodermatophilaceae bacterium]